jgi:hypothetical protein
MTRAPARPRRLIAAGPALAAHLSGAEPPRLSPVFGDDRVSAPPDDARSVHRIDEGSRGAALVIRLDTRRTTVQALGHLGETGQLLISQDLAADAFLSRGITDARFILCDPDSARIDHLQALLTAKGCDPQPYA